MWRWTYTRYFWVADEEQKQLILGVYVGTSKTYIRYSEVVDIKKVLGGDCLFKLTKGGNLKKEFGKPWSTLRFSIIIKH